MNNVYDVIRRPVVTEKGLAAKENHRTLCLEVAPAATKTDIKTAVERIFKVKVESVRTATFVGKERRRGRYAGYRPDWKKAFVKLKEGEKMVEYAAHV
jgi:large subunit ribosomal protein L23